MPYANEYNPAKQSVHSEIISAAIEYAGLGLRVVRLEERSKHPNIPDWPNTGATIQPEVIRRWFAEQPKANLGIVGGNGLAILDVDRDKGGPDSLFRLFADHGENGKPPAMALAYTGSGGFHIYFRVPANVTVGSPTGFRLGLDVRSKGGQVVAPPSIHPATERRYIWIRHTREGIALIPKWLLSLLIDSTDSSADPKKFKKGRSGRDTPNPKREFGNLSGLDKISETVTISVRRHSNFNQGGAQR